MNLNIVHISCQNKLRFFDNEFDQTPRLEKAIKEFGYNIVCRHRTKEMCKKTRFNIDLLINFLSSRSTKKKLRQKKQN